jgi:VIT1/CCC1 family predicted Fe2+/Mn2+ transporter
MISTAIIGAIVELIGAIIMIYNLAQVSLEGWGDVWPWVLMGSVLMIVGFVLLYAAFRPVIM